MRYQLTVSFETDRDMTHDEIIAMSYNVHAQIEEPMTWNPEFIDMEESDLRTSNIEHDLFKVGE